MILMKWRSRPTYIEVGSTRSGGLKRHWFVQIHKHEQIKLQYQSKQEFPHIVLNATLVPLSQGTKVRSVTEMFNAVVLTERNKFHF